MNRLSKKGRFNVLGIEAGLNLTNDPAIQAVGLPAFLLPATAPQKYFWPGWKQTVPMAGLNGRVADWVTGFIVGGGSAINGLYYGRGSNAVYSQWQALSGGSSNWSLAKILEAFQKLENYEGLTVNPGRGVGGPVNVLQTPSVSPLTLNVLLPSLLGALPGIPLTNDYNSPGVQNCIDLRAQWFIDPTGTQRVSSSTAFLGPTVLDAQGKGINGHSLRLLTGATVVKIGFSKRKRGGKLRAKYVYFLLNGELVRATARRAIVLAGGINSSKILQLSGIGPRSLLDGFGIRTLFNNSAVGQSLQNHPTLFITLLADPVNSGIPPGATYSFTIANVYLPVVGQSADSARSLQILFEFLPQGTASSPVPLLVMGFNLLNPVSLGSVNLQSANPFEIAAADDAFYQNPHGFNKYAGRHPNVHSSDTLAVPAALSVPIALLPTHSDPARSFQRGHI
jgi:choline dehydrogenase